ncbi:MAG: CotH kinase family protein [Deltaproteobacteria bacterium]|nr:CotH kinase family protein [Deltaproteobacteria bacterium]
MDKSKVNSPTIPRATSALCLQLLLVACSAGDSGLSYRVPAQNPEDAEIACALTDSGCSWDVSPEPNDAEASPPWPTELTPLPDCETAWDGSVEPELEAASGSIALKLSSPMQPAGPAVRVEVEVLASDGTIDRRLQGEEAEWLLETDPGATLVDRTALENGRALAFIRFGNAGKHRITASLASDERRSGRVELLVYQTQLPIWEIAVEEEELEAFLGGSLDQSEATLTVDGRSYIATIAPDNAAESDLAKRSWRLRSASENALPNGRQTLVLRAESNDETMMRNYLGLEIFRNGTWLPTPLAEPIHLRVNGVYYGLMWYVESIDADFLARNGLNPQGSLYYSPPSRGGDRLIGNLTALPSREAYIEAYRLLSGSQDYQDLIEFIERIQSMEDLDFVTTIDQHLNTDSYLVYLAVMAIVQDEEHAQGNFYIYRDPQAADDRWFAIADDMDLSFGLVSFGASNTREQTLVWDRQLRFGNRLMSRLYSFTQFNAIFDAFATHLLDQVFSRDFIDQRVDNFLCRAANDIMADPKVRREGFQTYLDRVDELRNFVEQRVAFIQTQVEN